MEAKKLIYGFVGKMGAGKDTFCDYLIYKGIIDEKRFFSKKVKDIAIELFDIDIKDRSIKNRKILQGIGQGMRDIDPDVWVNYLLKELIYYSKKGGYSFGITDVRYMNEADRIMENEGFLIMLSVTDDMRRNRVSERDEIEIDDEKWDEINSHPSEIEVDSIIDKYKSYDNVIILHQEDNDYNVNTGKMDQLLKEKSISPTDKKGRICEGANKTCHICRKLHECDYGKKITLG